MNIEDKNNSNEETKQENFSFYHANIHRCTITRAFSNRDYNESPSVREAWKPTGLQGANKRKGAEFPEAN